MANRMVPLRGFEPRFQG